MPILSSAAAQTSMITEIDEYDPCSATPEEVACFKLHESGNQLAPFWYMKYGTSNQNLFPLLATIIANFKDNLENALSTDLLPVVRLAGSDLFKSGADIAKTHFDDRPLYWARLVARRILKRRITKLTRAEKENLIAELEKASRNLDAITFQSGVGAKKFISTGFDPFIASRQSIEVASNTSGIAALCLHGESVTNSFGGSATIQCCIFPTRWQDFDRKIVENTLQSFITDTDKRVDMILTMSLDGSLHQTDPYISVIERFATVVRTQKQGAEDNRGKTSEFAQSCELLGAEVTNYQWIQTTLPTGLMSNESSNFKIQFRQSYDILNLKNISNHRYLPLPNSSYRKYNSSGFNLWNYLTELSKNPVESETNPNSTSQGTKDYLLIDSNRTELLRSIKIDAGSGGNFLSNEIFYRVALMRERCTSTIGEITPFISTGHLHVPEIFPETKTFASDPTTPDVQKFVEHLKLKLADCIPPTSYFVN
jgi:hypothetical protein